MKPDMHLTRDGRCIPITAMSDQHLLNTIHYNRRVARDGLATPVGVYGVDVHYYDDVTVYDAVALQRMHHSAYLEEAKRRNLEVL
jgi:hypothetical protein